MPNLKEVKSRILSVISTQQITKAMKMVAAAKLRRAQDNIIQMRPYAQKLDGVLRNVTAGLDPEDGSKFNVEREVNRVLLITITSDRGLCGAFNSNINKATLGLIEDKYAAIHKRGDLDILPLGKKAYDFYRKRKYNIITDFWKVFSDLSFFEATKAADFAIKKFEAGEYDRVDIIYNEFKNVATQIVRKEQYLPIPPSDDDSAVESDYIFQPDKEKIVEEVVPKSLKVQLYKAILESNAAEQGARMTAMEKATENAGDLLKELRISYNRTRQAAITTEINEIVAGAQALG